MQGGASLCAQLSGGPGSLAYLWGPLGAGPLEPGQTPEELGMRARDPHCRE